MTIDILLDRLTGVRRNGEGRYMAQCPAHDDRSPSLSIRETGDGTILVHCFAGCGAADVVAAIGLELTDLFLEPLGHHRQPCSRRRRRRLPAHKVLDAVSEALTILTLADSALMRGEPLTNDDYDAVDRALAVLSQARREVA